MRNLNQDTPHRVAAVLSRGHTSASEARNSLDISQPTFSRAIRSLGGRVLVAGQARYTRYALRRLVGNVDSPIPIYEVLPDGTAQQLFVLHPIEPDGFYVERFGSSELGTFYEDLPYFLHDLRPSGFLGRLIPLQNPDLQLPSDIRLWTANDTLRYVTSRGWDLVGSLIVGQESYRSFLHSVLNPPRLIPQTYRESEYPRLAEHVRQTGPAGSSAAGEQPKFLTNVDRGDGGTPVLVKFSPRRRDGAAQRMADLLVCEHVALNVLRSAGAPASAAASQLVFADERVFLEVERFDRIGLTARRGVVSLDALDLEFVGSTRRSWTTSTQALAQNGVIPGEAHHRTRWLQLFGQLIANTDMHFGNLSFFTTNGRVTSLAHAYDVLPMLFQPQHGEIVDRTFNPPLPSPADADIAGAVWRAALNFWDSVRNHDNVSSEFRQIASTVLDSVHRLEPALQLLPRPPH